MNETELIDIIRQAILLTIQIGTPPMMVGLVVGVSIALLQALTQVQEITLVFVPKILAIFMTIFILFPGMMTLLIAFTESLADRMVTLQ